MKQSYFQLAAPRLSDVNQHLSFDSDGTGSGAAVQIATLSNKPLLTNKDIVVIA